MAQPYRLRILGEIDEIINQMQYLTEHPRLQQRNWVAAGKRWLPVLQYAREEIERHVHADVNLATYESVVAAIQRLGLIVAQREDKTWGYSWNNEELTGRFPTQAEAIEVALHEKLM
jgi:hypothetical protein